MALGMAMSLVHTEISQRPLDGFPSPDLIPGRSTTSRRTFVAFSGMFWQLLDGLPPRIESWFRWSPDISSRATMRSTFLVLSAMSRQLCWYKHPCPCFNPSSSLCIVLIGKCWNIVTLRLLNIQLKAPLCLSTTPERGLAPHYISGLLLPYVPSHSLRSLDVSSLCSKM